MPLPDADPPEESRLYEELKSKTALPGPSGSITSDLIDNLKNATFLDSDNEDQLRRLSLIMAATGTGSFSGPVANGCIFKSSGDMTGTNVTATIFQPGIGEVYQLIECEVLGTPADTPRVRLFVERDGGGSAERVEFGDITFTSNSTERFDGSKAFGPAFIDDNFILKANLINGSSTTVEFRAYLTRVR